MGFPSKSERLLLNVAANEAAVGLQEAQRKEELAIANQELTKQTEQREAAQEALRLVEGRLSQILQGAATEDARTSEVAELRKKYARLTPREREVLPFVVAGWLSKQTAAELGTSESTIRVHRGQIMRKMQAHSLAELIRMSDRLGIRRLSRAGVAGSG